MHDASLPTHNTHLHETSLLSKNWHLSRRGFLGAAMAGLLSACGSSPAPISQIFKAPLAPAMLTPTASISLANAAQIQKLGVLHANAGAVRGLAWSPDGKTLALGAWQTAQIWDVATGKLIARLPGVIDQAYQMAWSPDGQLLAAGIADNTTRVWDMRSHRLLQTLQGTESVVFSVAWSPQGDHLATGNSDGVVQIWERATWSESGSWNDPASTGQFS
ncbi:MAG TPA: hypothetical protein VGM01_00555, partial [Ktedonobacteraceae bacterium]